MSEYGKSQDELIRDQQNKFKKVKESDWGEEVRELKNDNTGKSKNNN